MFEDGFNINELDKNYKKKIEDFAKKTLKDVENKSKMFCTTVNQVAASESVR